MGHSGDEYVIDINSLNRNHPLSSAYNQPSNTRISETEKKIIAGKSKLGGPSRIILAELSNTASSTAVYNCVAKHQKSQLGDQSPISAFLKILKGEDGMDSGNEDKKW
ncbi:hypothetical protein K3495_g4709 [Podosphaera aphanis]|nr:hypothetical protein K3495_g4709 [Podosphaera aphanis]